MYCYTVHSGNAERFRLDNLVSFMLHELVFLGSHSQFVSFRTRSHRILTVVKFYNHTFWLRYGSRPMRYLSPWGSTNQNSHKYWSSLTNGRSYKPISPWIRLLATCQSALNQSDATTAIKLVSTKAGRNAKTKNTVTS